MIEILHGMHETIRYEDLEQFRMYHNLEHEDYPLHWHMGIEIILPLSGSYTVVLQKERLKLEEGDIIIINTGIIHGLEAPLTGERVIIQFDISLLNILKEFETMLFMMPDAMVFRTGEQSDIYGIVHRNLHVIIREYDEDKTFNEAFIYAKLIEMYGELARRELYQKELIQKVDLGKQHGYIEPMFRTCDYINHHYMENITLEQAAAVSGFSKFHFTRVFKQFMDMTFYDYLNQKRIKQATLLLHNEEMSVTEIAMESGFNSISTFNRTFLSAHGMSPSAYRSSRRGGNCVPPGHWFGGNL